MTSDEEQAIAEILRKAEASLLRGEYTEGAGVPLGGEDYLCFRDFGTDDGWRLTLETRYGGGGVSGEPIRQASAELQALAVLRLPALVAALDEANLSIKTIIERGWSFNGKLCARKS